MPIQSKQLNFKGQNIFIGIDVHLRSWSVAIIVSGVKIKPFSQDPSASVLKSYLERNYPGGNYLSAYESGFCGFSVHYNLMKEGIKNIVFNAADISDTHKERSRKTDATDAAKIARNLSNGELKAIHVPTEKEIADRELLRTRAAVVKTCTQTKMRIKSLLYLHGISYPEQFQNNGTHWSRKFVAWVEEEAGKLPYDAGRSLLIHTSALKDQRRRILEVTRSLRSMLKTDSEYAKTLGLVISVPVIGFITAATFILEVGDISRFRSNDRLASYIGLVPDTRSSGPREVATGVTSRSNRHLRAMFIESAWHAVRMDAALTLAYSRLCARMEPNKAIIRIARKLVNRVAHVIRNDTTYEKSIVQ